MMFEDDVLIHYGTPRHSGRYPWGSGDNPYQHEIGFLGYVSDLRKQGLSEKEIADGLGISTTELRAKKSIAKNEERAAKVAEAIRLKDSGMSNMAIGRQMGLNESSVRALLDPTLKARADKTNAAAQLLKDNVDKKGFIDIGTGVEYDLNVSRTRMDTAVAMLKEQGYTVHYVQIDQLGTEHKTTIKVLAPPGTTYKDVVNNRGEIHTITDAISKDDGVTRLGIKPPSSVDSGRIQIRYAEDGGADKEGVIELRRGAEDLSLGNSKYAQVRIAVDGKYYLKGMAMYADDMPDGVDIIVNTKKHNDIPKEEVFKKMKEDPDNPFGATIKANGQRTYIDENGEEKLSPINKVNEEGDWGEWSKSLASQMLSKQSVPLAKRQLDLDYASKKQEFEEIKSITNPEVKKKLLEGFADDCDASAVDLKAAALPRQASHVILPFPDMKDNEIYAPNYRDGERVVLIRYPHGGTFEIPELTVNNHVTTAKSVIGNARDAVGINANVAAKLSGADFDGDTVLVIPTNNVKIRTSVLKKLEGFDTIEAYPGYEGMPKMSNRTKQLEMGKVSNLITDMTLKGASPDELVRAVKHSMVVIDAEKHNLNYKQSYIDFGIAELKDKYQSNPDGTHGASTLISRAKSPVRIPIHKDQYDIDPETGKKIYKEANEKDKTYTVTKVSKKTGAVTTKEIPRTMEVPLMSTVDDARTLSSGTMMESVYASYANRMKSMGNEARKEYLAVQNSKYSPSAKKEYASEVESLNSKLTIALKNAPKERQAQILANEKIAAIKRDNPNIDNEHLKKQKGQALAAARNRVGAKKERITINEREWEAIQKGAISSSKMSQILNNCDLDVMKKIAMPKETRAVTRAKEARIKAMEAAGFTTAEIADAVGVSTSTVSNVVNGG